MNLNRKLQLIELEIMDIFIDICNRHNLKYFMIAGSLIGAIRHEGFIPWDDDIDIGMPIVDYKKFTKIWKKEQPKGFFLQNLLTDDAHTPFPKIRKDNTVFEEKTIGSFACHKGIYIDIFLFAYCNKRNIFRPLLSLVTKTLARLVTSSIWRKNHSGFRRFVRGLIPGRLLYRVLLCLEGITKENKATHMRNLFSIHDKKDFPKSYFLNTGVANFENRRVSIPKDSDTYLRELYGDYMVLPPEDERVPKHQTTVIDFGDYDFKNASE